MTKYQKLRAIVQKIPKTDACILAKPSFMKEYTTVTFKSHMIGTRMAIYCAHNDLDPCQVKMKGGVTNSCKHGNCINPRHSVLQAEAPDKRKLTKEQVLSIRKKRIEGAYLKEIGAEYSISTSDVYKVANRLTYRDIEGE